MTKMGFKPLVWVSNLASLMGQSSADPVHITLQQKGTGLNI